MSEVLQALYRVDDKTDAKYCLVLNHEQEHAAQPVLLAAEATFYTILY